MCGIKTALVGLASLSGSITTCMLQRRPASASRSQNARAAPEDRALGTSALGVGSVLGAGSVLMEELRAAAMARARQQAPKPQPVRLLRTLLADGRHTWVSQTGGLEKAEAHLTMCSA